jgi:ABC-type Fe3+/spermidine/putrescine transport system ATPase subunit
MRDGQVEQVGEPRFVYRKPASRFVADFMGGYQLASRRSVSKLYGTAGVRNRNRDVYSRGNRLVLAGQHVLLGFRPEAVEFGAGQVNSIQTTVADVSYLGEIEQYGLKTASELIVKALERNPTEVRQIGAQMVVHVRPENMMILGMK